MGNWFQRHKSWPDPVQSQRNRAVLPYWCGTMWIVERATIAAPAGGIVTLAHGARGLSVGEVVALWRDDAAFRNFFIEMLASSSCEAFFWEMPPLDSGALTAAFECAIIRSDALARMRADDSDFAVHLRGSGMIAVFPNLGGDALLIAPRKVADTECYGHIASFVRSAPREQAHALFRALALEIEKRVALSRDCFWVSTSGLGVPWVHVRLDATPKYYQYTKYIA